MNESLWISLTVFLRKAKIFLTKAKNKRNITFEIRNLMFEGCTRLTVLYSDEVQGVLVGVQCSSVSGLVLPISNSIHIFKTFHILLNCAPEKK